MLAYNIEEQKVQIATFDGPLELLLYLVKKEGLGILEVPIARITNAYMAHIRTIDLLNLNTAGDFLLMASTLCYLKCQELLRNPDEEAIVYEEEDDPIAIKERLRLQLINYQRCKEASITLGKRNLLGRDIFTRPKTEQNQHLTTPKITTDALGLLKIFQRLLHNNRQQKQEIELIRARYSIREMSLWILNHLLSGSTTLNALLLNQDTLPDRIVCFLSVLELARHNYINFEQKEHLSPIHISPLFSGEIPKLPLYDEELVQQESF
jgi:segregation and condensation protein A